MSTDEGTTDAAPCSQFVTLAEIELIERHGHVVALVDREHELLVLPLEVTAKVVAERVVEHLERSGFVIMRKPVPIGCAGHNPVARTPGY